MAASPDDKLDEAFDEDDYEGDVEDYGDEDFEDEATDDLVLDGDDGIHFPGSG